MPRVLIVDDDARFRAVARLLLERAGLHVIGEADRGSTALDAIRRLNPDVVLLDVQLPDIDGFEVARRLHGTPHVILVSSREESDYGPRLGAAPVRGFLTKTELSAANLLALL